MLYPNPVAIPRWEGRMDILHRAGTGAASRRVAQFVYFLQQLGRIGHAAKRKIPFCRGGLAYDITEIECRGQNALLLNGNILHVYQIG